MLIYIFIAVSKCSEGIFAEKILFC